MIIDLSVHNGSVDFTKLTGVSEVIIRATIGYGTTDANLLVNAHKAAEAGFPVSYYHFAYPHDTINVVEDSTSQANYFISIIAPLPAAAHLCVDVEEYDNHGTDTKLSKADYELWLQSFFNTVKEVMGVDCVLYSYKDYLDRHLPADHKLGRYKLWLASYTPGITAPHLPVGWTSYWLWQYSEHGAPGVPRTDIDVSRYNQQQ